MRLDFNIVIVDDTFVDKSKSRQVEEMIESIKKHVFSKGLIPYVFKFENIDAFYKNKEIDNKNHNNRIDLFLSDNNLEEYTENKSGIDLYLKLKEEKNENELLCDFLLYTNSETKEITHKLIKKLEDKQNPNLFSRFTFVTKSDIPGNTEWHDSIKALIDTIITSREEMNNLRGLFAQETAKIENRLKQILGYDKNVDISLSKLIHEASGGERKRKYLFDDLKADLHFIKELRNNIIHNDERICEKTGEYIIKCDEIKIICDNNTQQTNTVNEIRPEMFNCLRKELLRVVKLFEKRTGSI